MNDLMKNFVVWALIAVAVLGEWLSAWQWVGVGVVVLGLVLFEKASGKG